VKCSGSGPSASVITFSQVSSDGTFAPITASSVVFQPGNASFDEFGTEDPRIYFDAFTALYYMFYTSYGPSNVLLSLASTPVWTS
jgi:predicted GH43/DUF377 family glycosyl hydrolase